MNEFQLHAIARLTILACLASACGGTPHTNSVDTGPTLDAGAEASSPLEAAATPDGGSIPGLATTTWTWVPFPAAKCRDGSSTGIGVSYNPSSTEVMIFLESGGACFNAATCADNPLSFGQAEFEALAASTMDNASLNNGIFDRTNASNPVKDWSFVYVPYCTGDIHSGNTTNVVPGVDAPQAFVGYANVGLYLNRIVPTFPNATKVLLAGMSAGGFGAPMNYEQVARAFGSVPVVLLDDSGPPMEDPYLSTCLQNQVRALWGLDGTVGAACGSGCTNPPSFFLDVMKHDLEQFPSATFGFTDSAGDSTISGFFGYGANDCTGTSPLSSDTYFAGLKDMIQVLAAPPNYGYFVFDGLDHTSLHSSVFYSRTAKAADGGVVSMTDWVTALIGGQATHAGP